MNTTRRGFLASLAAAPQLLAQNPRDVRIVDVATSREDYTYRAPLKFGGAIVDREIGRASCRERV